MQSGPKSGTKSNFGTIDMGVAWNVAERRPLVTKKKSRPVLCVVV
jgi:hypothetical protein